MDINELNKLSITAQFSKLVSQANLPGLGADSFAGLLEKNTADLFSTDKVADKSENIQDLTDKKSEKPSAKEESKYKEDKVEKNDSQDKVQDKKTEEKDSPKEETAQNEEQKDENAADEDNSDKLTLAYAAPMETANIPQPTESLNAEEGETLQDLTAVSAETLLNKIASGEIVVLDENGNQIAPENISTDTLSQMQSLTLVATQSQESLTLNGSELAQKIMEAQQVSEVLSGTEMPKDLSQVTTPAAKAQSKGKNIVDITTEDPQIVDLAELEDVQKIEENLADKQVKLSINVKEEKISYLNQKELVKNSFALQEAESKVDAQAQNATTTQASTATMTKPSSVQTENLQAQVAMQNMQNTAEAVNNQQQNMAVTDIKSVAAKADIGNGAVISGAEFNAAAKAEAADKSMQTSFRDIYKGMSKEAVEQVKVNITKSAVKGVDTIEVRLKPEDLGHIEIKMQIKDGKLQAHIISSRPETMEALQRDAQVLEKAFNDAGFETDGNSLSFSFRNDGRQAQEQGEQLRSFIGKVFEQEANPDIITSEAANQNWTAEKGLNIRV